ncbi:acyl-homoserine-lactone synthase [Blastochloris viridis]|nr:acyl-homoserine-lactone synthase [Blastochloris viridis]CUU41913.1 putative autoinducer synthesis protein [Blastochloris viridis]
MNRHLYKNELMEHFHLRYDIYVRDRKWMDLDRPVPLEIDQFDTLDAFYLLSLDGSRLVGGSRLIPSTRPHLLGDVFPDLALRGVPRQPDVFEWTRIFVAKAHRGGDSRALGEILCGICEFSLEEGISAITAVAEMWWTPRLLEMGWKVEPLGLPRLIEGEPCNAFRFAMDEEVLDSTRRYFGVDAPVLLRRAPELVAAEVARV